MPRAAKIDAVDLEVYWSRLISIADEAATALRRTSFSTIVRESNDFATAILDADALSLAENTIGVPSFLGILPRALRAMLEHIPVETLKDGDCVITNDPWIGAGHLPDLVTVMPIYFRGRRVAYSAAVAHLPDIGGSLLAADAKQVYEEGLRIPPSKFLRAGVENVDLSKIIRANVRVPDQVIRDIYAQIASHRVAASGVREFLEDSDLADLGPVSMALHDRAARSMAGAVEKLPSGTFHSTVLADGAGGDEPTKIQCALTIDAGEIKIDFAGSSAQVEKGLNSVLNYTFAYSAYAIKCALDPQTPNNEGSYRHIKIEAPEGSILNPKFPAACNARQLTGQLVTSAVFKCLAQVIPGRIIAESGNTPTLRAVFSGVDDGARQFSQMLFCNGGMGATPRSDGHSCTSFPTNTCAGSVEALEAVAPLIVWRKEYRQDSGGAGTFRGGLGQNIEIEVVSGKPVNLSLMSDRQGYPPEGLDGGGTGAPVEIFLADGTVPPTKGRSILQPGARLELRFAGGGGYGPPNERSRDAIVRDVEDGLISAEAALGTYGVELSAGKEGV
jgi:N-methylhydantoinase B